MTKLRRVRRLTAPIAVLAALALAGCGAQGSTAEFEGEQERVAQAIEDLQEAGRESDERRICRQLLAPELAGEFDDCNAGVDEALKAADGFDLTVEKVEVSGTSATAEVQSGRDSGEVRTVTLAKEGDAWKLADLGEPPAGP